MEHITIGKKYNEGKVARVECIKNGALNHIDIQNTCFLLILLKKGKLEFVVGGKHITATAPAFVCFDESENPMLAVKAKAQYTCIYFHPNFLNVNMSFDLLRSDQYDDMASVHDLFLLKPFIDKAYVVPIVDTQVEKIDHAAECMQEELENQRDWYWSCRGRSYFMEVIIALERMYGLMGYGLADRQADRVPVIVNPKLRTAVLYIEGHYGQNMTLEDIAAHVGVNRTTLTVLMKQELGCTAMEYLMKYRIVVAKKQLAFTDVPIKDIAGLVGFKTVQHFNRLFKAHTGTTPAAFRKGAVQKRMEEMQ